MKHKYTPAELIEAVANGAIKQGPIRHRKLPPLLLEEIQRLWHSVGKVFYRNQSTLEQWEVGFMRDCNQGLRLTDSLNYGSQGGFRLSASFAG